MSILAAMTASATLFLLLVYVIRSRGVTSGEARLRYLSPSRDVRVEEDGDEATLVRRSASSIPAINRWLSTRGYADRWAFELERADLKLRPGEYFLMRVCLAVVTAVLFALIGRSAPALLIGIVAGGMAYQLPAVWVRLRMKRRIEKINKQLPETIGLIASGVRAGFAFAQSVDVTAQRVGPPISVELNRMLVDINLGASTEDALQAMNQRIGSDDVDIVVTAILIQRNTGGNLAEVLETVTETMRDRERIAGEIKTLTSSQRLTGWVLSLWPAALGLIFFAINPGMMSLMWTTTAGLVLLGIWVVLNTMGILTIRRILDIDI